MRYRLAVWAAAGLAIVALHGQYAVAAAALAVSAPPATPDYTVADSALSNPLVFIVYGDMRFTDPAETEAAAPGPRRALVEKVASEHPDALFLTGDIPWHGGDLDDYREYGDETAIWKQQHLRLYPVLGNHEFSQCEEARCLQNWWHAFPQFDGRRWYSVALGSRIRAFALDSNSSLRPGSEQRQWLQQQIAGLPSTVRFVLLTLHHPPVADQAFAIVRDNERSLRDYLTSTARKSPVLFIVCSGHVHNYERFVRRGVVYLVSGGGGAKPLRVHRFFSDRYRASTFPNYHYIRFEMQADGLHAEIVRLMDYQAPMPQTWAVKDRFDIWPHTPPEPEQRR